MSKLVLKSTTSSSLNDRFSKLMKNRPENESSRPIVDSHGSLKAGSDRNRRLAEQLERKNSTDVRRKPLSHRIGDIGQGGARTLAAALQGTRGYNQGNLQGRVGKRSPLAGRLAQPNRQINRQSQQSSTEANRALKKAQNMLKQTERELAQLKRQKATKIQQTKITRTNKSTRGGGGGRGGRGGRGGGRGAGRGGAQGGRGQKPKSAGALDAELDAFMLGTKGGLDNELDAYMSSTKNGLDKQMDDYMAAKNSE